MRSVLLMAHLIVLFLVLSSASEAGDWTRFRGPNGQGISEESGLPVTWSATENIAWKTPLPGQGWSSPIVQGDRIFVTTATDEGTSCRIICIDRKNGRVLWNTEVHQQETGPKRRQNSFCTPTPVTDGTNVYAVFFDGTIVGVDGDGQLLWKNQDVQFHSLHGLGASPMLTKGQLIMPFDGSSREETRTGWKEPWDQARILAVDLSTGKTRWTARRGLSRVGHVTPILLGAGDRFVSAGGDRVQAFDLDTGKLIWSVYSQGEGVTPSPVTGEGLIFTSSGFEAPTLRAIRPGGQGDVTKTHIAWEQKKGVPALASPLYVAPNLYTITRDNILHCFRARDGELVWQKRLDGVHSASPVFADGRIYTLSEDGVTLVFRPGDRYEEQARNELGETCLASFAISQGQILVRSSEHLFCIGRP